MLTSLQSAVWMPASCLNIQVITGHPKKGKHDAWRSAGGSALTTTGQDILGLGLCAE